MPLTKRFGQPHGCLVVHPSPPKPKVITTRVLQMPDGTQLVCRKRESPKQGYEWTAEIPLEVAKEVFTND